MIRDKNELLAIKVIGFGSSVVSYIFTITMLMSFANTQFDKVLYFCCGLIIDGAKWFTLITLIKYYRAKLYKNFYLYTILFILFLTMSVIASVSYSIYTVKSQLYEVKTIENTALNNANETIEKLKTDVAGLENSKSSELTRLNTELDGLPLDYISRRKEIEDKKLELTTMYDKKINNATWQLNEKKKELEAIPTGTQEEKILKNNPIANFFETFANVLNADIDLIITIFAIALGVLLDLISVSLTFDSAFSYQNKRSFNKDMTNFKNLREINKKLKDYDNDEDETKPTGTDSNIINLTDFVRYCADNNIDIDTIEYKDVKGVIKQSTFYKYIGKLKDNGELATM